MVVDLRSFLVPILNIFCNNNGKRSIDQKIKTDVGAVLTNGDSYSFLNGQPNL